MSDSGYVWAQFLHWRGVEDPCPRCDGRTRSARCRSLAHVLRSGAGP